MESGGAGKEGMSAYRCDDDGKWSPTCSRTATQQKIGRVSGRPREPVFRVSHSYWGKTGKFKNARFP